MEHRIGHHVAGRSRPHAHHVSHHHRLRRPSHSVARGACHGEALHHHGGHAAAVRRASAVSLGGSPRRLPLRLPFRVRVARPVLRPQGVAHLWLTKSRTTQKGRQKRKEREPGETGPPRNHRIILSLNHSGPVLQERPQRSPCVVPPNSPPPVSLTFLYAVAWGTSLQYASFPPSSIRSRNRPPLDLIPCISRSTIAFLDARSVELYSSRWRSTSWSMCWLPE